MSGYSLPGHPEPVEEWIKAETPRKGFGGYPLILNWLKDDRITAGDVFRKEYPLILNPLKDGRIFLAVPG